MKFLKRLFIWTGIIIVFAYFGLSLYIATFGKNILVKTISSTLNQPVTIERLTYQFPYDLIASNVAVLNLFQTPKIQTRVDIKSLIDKKVILTSLDILSPRVTLKRSFHEKSPVDRDVTSLETKKISPDESGMKFSNNNIYIHRFSIHNGSLLYSDPSSSHDLSFHLDRLQLQVGPLSFPVRSTRSSFDFTASLTKETLAFSQNAVKGTGWADLLRKNMNADIKIFNSDGRPDFKVHLYSKENDMTVQGSINLKNFLNSRQNEKPLENSIDQLVLGAFSSMGLEIGTDFSFKTKMDNFHLGKISFSGNVSTHENRDQPINSVER